MLSKAQTRLLLLCAALWVALCIHVFRWNGNDKLRPVAFPFEHGDIACADTPILWGRQGLFFCGYGATSLVAVDYQTGNVRKLAARTSLFSPKTMLGDASTLVFDDEGDLLIVDLVHGGATRVPAPCKSIDGLAWSNNKIRVMCNVRDERGSDLRFHFTERDVSRDGTMGAERTLGEFVSTSTSILAGPIQVTPARFADNQWWFLVVRDAGQVWDNLNGSTLPVATPINPEYELLAGGQVNERALSLIAPDGTAITRRPHSWATNRLVLQPDGLHRVASEKIDDTSERVTIADATNVLHYQRGSVDGDDVWHRRRYNVTVAKSRVVMLGFDEGAQAEPNRVGEGLATVADGAGGMFVTDRAGNYAHINSAGARVDPLHFREANERSHMIWRLTLYLWPVVIAAMLLFAWLRRRALVVPSKLPTAQVHGKLRVPRLFWATRLNTFVLIAATLLLLWAHILALA